MSAADLSTIFVDPPQHPGYRIGRDGSIWSCWHKGNRPVITKRWRKLKPGRTPSGYLFVTFYPGGKQRYVHRLVLESFVGPCPPGMEACHNDNNRTNNVPSNLRWDTHKNNLADRTKHGTHGKGELSSFVILTSHQVLQIRSEYAAGGVTQRELGERFGVGAGAVGAVIRRKTWSHI